MATIKRASYVEKTAAAIAKKAVLDAVKTITGNTAGTKNIKAAAKTVPIDTTVQEKHAYIFFNCDADKTPASMNIRYNDEAFSDSAAGRQALLEKIEEELAAGNIKISDIGTVKEAILKGQPTAANAMIAYGSIEYLLRF